MITREAKNPAYIKEIAQIMEAHGLSRVVIDDRGAEVILEKNAAASQKTALTLGEPPSTLSMSEFSGSLGSTGTGSTGTGSAGAGSLGAGSLGAGSLGTGTAGTGSAGTSEASGTVTSGSITLDNAITALKVEDVVSPMVGVYYSSPSPDKDSFVRIGTKVKKGDILCILEAMKLMNEIQAEKDGTIVDICAKNGDVVEFGQVLFKVDVG